MKDSYFRTPRTLNDCQWTYGYQTGGTEPKAEKVAGYVLAATFGVVLAWLLVVFLST